MTKTVWFCTLKSYELCLKYDYSASNVKYIFFQPNIETAVLIPSTDEEESDTDVDLIRPRSPSLQYVVYLIIFTTSFGFFCFF